MRTLTTHRAKGADDLTTISVVDHVYTVCLPAKRVRGNRLVASSAHQVRFQNGTVKEVGFNGVTNEQLIAIVLDRLNQFQAGDFACAENGMAIINLERALDMLKSRTEDRLERGVEGSMQE